MANAHIYTNEEIKIIKQMSEEGKTFVEIGKAIGLHRTTVANYCKKNDIKNNCFKWTNENIMLLKELYNSGDYTIEQVAKKMNTTVDSIKGKAKSLKITINLRTSHNLLIAEEIAYIKENYDKMSIANIAKHLNRNDETIRLKIKEIEPDYKKLYGYKHTYEYYMEKEDFRNEFKNPAYSSSYLSRKYDINLTTIIGWRKKYIGDYKQMTDTFLCKTSAEMAVEEILDKLDLAYFYEKKIGKWRVDYYLGFKTIIEVQGTYWHSTDKAKKKDARKFKELKDLGYKIIEIQEKDLKNRAFVKELIKSNINFVI